MFKGLVSLLAAIAFVSMSVGSSTALAKQNNQSVLNKSVHNNITQPPGGNPETPPIETPPTEPNPPPTPEPQPEPGLRAKLVPAFYLDFDAGEKIINLTPHEPQNGGNSLLTRFNDPERDTLIYHDFRDGFEVTKYSNIEGGVGPSIIFNFENAVGLRAEFWLQVGIIPIAGKAAISTRYVETLDEAKHSPAITHIPEAEEILGWKTGEALTYECAGGLVSFIGAGFGPIGVSLAKITQGTFKTYIERQEEGRAIVKVSDTKTNSTYKCFNAGIVSACNSDFDSRNNPEGLDSIMTFSIDLSTEFGQKAFYDAIHGNVAAIQLFASSNNPEVQFLEKATTTQVGHFNGVFVGIPSLLFTNWTSGNIYEVSSTQDIAENTIMDAKYGIFLKESTGVAFFRHNSQIESFYGGVAKVTNQTGASTRRRLLDEKMGQYVLAISHDHTEPYKLSAAMKTLTNKTGLDSLIMFNIPKHDDLEFSNVELKVTMDAEHTMNMMNNMANLNDSHALRELATGIVDHYFATHDRDEHNACVKWGESLNEICHQEMVKETTRAAENMFRAASKMSEAADDDEAFVKAYANFGKAMLMNQFAFQTALRLADAGVKVSYRIESTSFSLVDIEYVTTSSPELLLPAPKKLASY